jgi:hypothetical protein
MVYTLLQLRSKGRTCLRRVEYHIKRQRTPSGAWHSPLKDLAVEELRRSVRCFLQPLLDVSCKSELVTLATAVDPDSCIKTVQETERIREGRIRVFGTEYDFGQSVDWNRDPRSGFAWPLDYHGDLKLVDLRNTADVRVVWELNRCHHLVVMGKAYWYTGETAYASRFRSETMDWARANPICRGVNWSCPMEVAIRAVNLAWAYCFFCDSEELDRDFHLFLQSLLESHGINIVQHLENLSAPRGNHYVADLVGLLYLGLLLPWSSHARRWVELSVRELKREMSTQVLGDGLGFEGSIPYHRLVTELFLHAAVLLGKSKRRTADADHGAVIHAATQGLGAEFLRRLELMCEAVIWYTRPDGLAPQIGDGDDGRLVKLGSPSLEVNDHRHLCAVAGELFNREDLRDHGYPCREEALWMFGRIPVEPRAERRDIESRAFHTSGFYFMRRGAEYAAIHCADLGTGGKGSHSHNDSLSFELCFHGMPYLVDPGTYMYSGAPELRNVFRLTRSHNTILVDDLEQNEPLVGDLFTMHSRSSSRVVRWEHGTGTDVFRGMVEERSSKRNNIRIVRQIRFTENRTTWQITDSVYGQGKHQIEWRFHASPDVKAAVQGDRAVLVAPGGELLEIRAREESRLRIGVEEGWYSQGYGRRERIDVVVYRSTVSIPAFFGFMISSPCSSAD